MPVPDAPPVHAVTTAYGPGFSCGIGKTSILSDSRTAGARPGDRRPRYDVFKCAARCSRGPRVRPGDVRALILYGASVDTRSWVIRAPRGHGRATAAAVRRVRACLAVIRASAARGSVIVLQAYALIGGSFDAGPRTPSWTSAPSARPSRRFAFRAFSEVRDRVRLGVKRVGFSYPLSKRAERSARSVTA